MIRSWRNSAPLMRSECSVFAEYAYKIFSTIFYLHNTLAHIVYQALYVQMTIRVSIPHKA